MEPITIQDAIREAGSLSALARRLNVTRAAIYQWRHRDGVLPELYCYRFLYGHKKARRRVQPAPGQSVPGAGDG